VQSVPVIQTILAQPLVRLTLAKMLHLQTQLTLCDEV